VAWIGKLAAKMVGKRTAEKDLIQLLSNNKFVDAFHYDNPEMPEPFACGALQLVASGFPVSPTTQDALIKFLRGSGSL
jgi:hypothetical protein